MIRLVIYLLEESDTRERERENYDRWKECRTKYYITGFKILRWYHVVEKALGWNTASLSSSPCFINRVNLDSLLIPSWMPSTDIQSKSIYHALVMPQAAADTMSGQLNIHLPFCTHETLVFWGEVMGLAKKTSLSQPPLQLLVITWHSFGQWSQSRRWLDIYIEVRGSRDAEKT